MESHAVTCHHVTQHMYKRPAITPAKQASTRFTYFGGTKT